MGAIIGRDTILKDLPDGFSVTVRGLRAIQRLERTPDDTQTSRSVSVPVIVRALFVRLISRSHQAPRVIHQLFLHLERVREHLRISQLSSFNFIVVSSPSLTFSV